MSNHEGKELELMLEGKKPLAMFYDDPDEDQDERIVPAEAFDRFVRSGAFMKAERSFELAFDRRIGRNLRIRYILYCLKGEEWRIEAMFLALKVRLTVRGYDEGIDRIVGALLGYSDDEVDSYIAARK